MGGRRIAMIARKCTRREFTSHKIFLCHLRLKDKVDEGTKRYRRGGESESFELPQTVQRNNISEPEYEVM